MSHEKVWFITGASRGFGRIWTEAALERGDKVAAAARNPAALAGLTEKYGPAVLPLELDVTKTAEAARAVKAAHERFGRLDVVVNNAGYGYIGAVEERRLTMKRIGYWIVTALFLLPMAGSAIPELLFGGPASTAATIMLRLRWLLGDALLDRLFRKVFRIPAAIG